MSIHLHSLNAAVVKNMCKILQNFSSNQTSSITECHRRAWQVPNTPPVYFWWRMMDLPSSKPSSVHSRGPPGQSSAQTPERAWLGNSFLFFILFCFEEENPNCKAGAAGVPSRTAARPAWGKMAGRSLRGSQQSQLLSAHWTQRRTKTSVPQHRYGCVSAGDEEMKWKNEGEKKNPTRNQRHGRQKAVRCPGRSCRG